MRRDSFSRLASLKSLNAIIALLIFVSGSAAIAAPIVRPGLNEAKNLARMNCGARIECITPDGHHTSIAPNDRNENGASNLIMDDDTVSCPLHTGDTTFIISLDRRSVLDRFTFINENAAARGDLRIAV